MPILPPEPSLYPEGLFEPAEINRHQQRWWVLHTRPRTEKSLARLAFRETIAFFLPQYIRRWRTGGRLFKSTLPLFPNYLFVRTDDDGRSKLLESGSVANSLEVHDQQRLHSDLARIHSLMSTGVPMTPEARLQPGMRVTITAGPLRGLEGTILRHGKNLRLLLGVHFMQQGVSVEVESWMVTPVPGEAGRRLSETRG
jgi:hypothetical protein